MVRKVGFCAAYSSLNSLVIPDQSIHANIDLHRAVPPKPPLEGSPLSWIHFEVKITMPESGCKMKWGVSLESLGTLTGICSWNMHLPALVCKRKPGELLFTSVFELVFFLHMPYLRTNLVNKLSIMVSGSRECGF